MRFRKPKAQVPSLRKAAGSSLLQSPETLEGMGEVLQMSGKGCLQDAHWLRHSEGGILQHNCLHKKINLGNLTFSSYI